MLERYVYKNQKKMRCGYTTGTCACAAAKAAACMLLSGRRIESVSVITPMGVELTLPVYEITMEQDSVTCAIKKDSGDDPDVTNGILIYASVSYIEGDSTDKRVVTDGGTGIGRITKKGLSRPVGEAAINPVPLKMIEEGVLEAAENYSYEGSLKVVISAPQGVEIAKKTFNPNLGITGGISILGTTGIVEPMSEQALIDTIRTEIKMHIAEGEKVLLIAPGNYGQDFLLNTLGIELKRSIKCSNYIGQSMDMAADCKFQGLVLAGHIGKLIKVSGGVMNTHSRWADCRMDLLATAMLRAGFSADRARAVLDCVTTDDALALLSEEEREATIGQIMRSIEKYMEYRMADQMPVGAILYSNVYGILGKTSKVDTLMHLWEEENQ